MECIVYTSYNKNRTTKCVLMDRPHILNKIMARNKLLPLWNNICVGASIPCLRRDINGTFILLYFVQIECTDGILLACNRILSMYNRSTQKKQLVIKFNDSQSILVIMMAMITAKWQWNDTEINNCKKSIQTAQWWAVVLLRVQMKLF